MILREFWIYEDNGDTWVSEINWNDQEPKGIHVREVATLTQEQIAIIMTVLNVPVKHQIGFSDGLAYAMRKND